MADIVYPPDPTRSGYRVAIFDRGGESGGGSAGGFQDPSGTGWGASFLGGLGGPDGQGPDGGHYTGGVDLVGPGGGPGAGGGAADLFQSAAQWYKLIGDRAEVLGQRPPQGQGPVTAEGGPGTSGADASGATTTEGGPGTSGGDASVDHPASGTDDGSGNQRTASLNQPTQGPPELNDGPPVVKGDTSKLDAGTTNWKPPLSPPAGTDSGGGTTRTDAAPSIQQLEQQSAEQYYYGDRPTPQAPLVSSSKGTSTASGGSTGTEASTGSGVGSRGFPGGGGGLGGASTFGGWPIAGSDGSAFIRTTYGGGGGGAGGAGQGTGGGGAGQGADPQGGVEGGGSGTRPPSLTGGLALGTAIATGSDVVVYGLGKAVIDFIAEGGGLLLFILLAPFFLESDAAGRPDEPTPKTPDECKEEKSKCINRCTSTLPTPDFGFRFWNCVNQCMTEAGC